MSCLRCFLSFKVRVWGISCLIGLGWGDSCVFSPGRPPCSVLGHGLGNRAAKMGHGTVVFSVRFFFVLPTPSSASSRGGGQGNLATHTVAQDCALFCFFSLLSLLICLLFVIRFQLGTSPSRGTVGCATLPFRVGFHISSFHPPRHAGDPWEGFDVGFPYHTACLSL